MWETQVWPLDQEAWRQKEKRGIEEEIVEWYYPFNGHELGQTPGDGEGQGGLACHSPWGRKESDTTWQLNTHTSVICWLCDYREVIYIPAAQWSCVTLEKLHNLSVLGSILIWISVSLQKDLLSKNFKIVYSAYRNCGCGKGMQWKGHMNILSLEKYIPCINQSSSFQANCTNAENSVMNLSLIMFILGSKVCFLD